MTSSHAVEATASLMQGRMIVEELAGHDMTYVKEHGTSWIEATDVATN